MKRFIAFASAVGLLIAMSAAAQADGIPVADSGPIPDCANIEDGTGTYSGNLLTVRVQLESEPCDGTNGESASYDLYVIADKPNGALSHPSDPHSMDIGTTSSPELLTSSYTYDDSTGAPTLVYEVTFADNDPTVCVFSVAHGSVTTTTTTTTTDEGDHNGNGTTNDDKHRKNEGSNSDGTKHDWDETTTTTTTTTHFVDRAPGDVDSTDAQDCLPISDVTTAWRLANCTGPLPPDDCGSSGKGYN